MRVYLIIPTSVEPKLNENSCSILTNRKELHDSNKDSISCAGSSGGCSDSTVSAHIDTNNMEASSAGNPGMDNDAFEHSGELSPSPLRYADLSIIQLLSFHQKLGILAFISSV